MKRGHIIGIELNEKMCQVSFYDEELKEPHTMEADADNYQIPLVIGRKGGSWVYGKEAQKEAAVGNAACVFDLLNFAKNQELVQLGHKTYEGIWLLSMFIQLVLKHYESIEAIAFTIPVMDMDLAQILKSVGQKLGVEKEHIYVQDYKESFCYYMFYQPKELWQYEAALFYCDKNTVKAYMLRKLKTAFGKGYGNFVAVDEVASAEMEELEEVYPVLNVDKAREADEAFKCFIQGVFDKRLISSVFLTGEGFENNWYPNSLRTLCNGRRAFQGNNLYSKGACYAAYNRAVERQEIPVYLDETKMTEQICLKLRVKGVEKWYPIVAWGTRWYEGDRQFEILLEDTEDIEIHIESLEKKEVEAIRISMEELPKRGNYTLRLLVSVVFDDEKTCRITWKDVGFGTFFEPSGFWTETVIHLGGNHGQFNSLS